MDKNYDISELIKDWSFDPSGISARWITGADGTLKIQLRLDLGLFQMEIEGRPDGKTPHGHKSLLDFYRAREKEEDGAGKPFPLDVPACTELQQEAMQFYYRYLSFYALHDMDGVIRDTDHNLDTIDLVCRHVEDEDMAWHFLQFYPYVRMMNARARAEKAMEIKDYEIAVADLQKALDDIHGFWSEYGDSEAARPSPEVELLTDLLRQAQKKKPRTPKDDVQDQLSRAIAAENYEQAAVLRDRLNRLSTQKPPNKEPDDTLS